MKQTILLSICFLLFAGTAPKEYKIKDATASRVLVAFATVYKYLDQSNMPHQDIKQLQFLLETADSSLRADMKDSTLNKNK